MQSNPYSSFAKAFKIYTTENKKFVWDSSGNPKELNTLILCQYHGGQNQRFYLTPTNNGKWRIMCLKSGYCLQPIQNKSGGTLIFATVKNTVDQEWQLIELKPNIYIIKGNKGLVIDVAGKTYKNQAKPILYQQHGDINQQWVLEKV